MNPVVTSFFDDKIFLRNDSVKIEIRLSFDLYKRFYAILLWLRTKCPYLIFTAEVYASQTLSLEPNNFFFLFISHCPVISNMFSHFKLYTTVHYQTIVNKNMLQNLRYFSICQKSVRVLTYLSPYQ